MTRSSTASCASIPDHVQQRFPQDPWLVDWQVEAYAGTPLFTAAGEPLGLICVMSKRPFADPAAVGAALQIFALRAAAEIERLQTVESLRASEERFRQIAENIRDVFCALRLRPRAARLCQSGFRDGLAAAGRVAAGEPAAMARSYPRGRPRAGQAHFDKPEQPGLASRPNLPHSPARWDDPLGS